MNLLVINGSPRIQASNTRRLLNKFLEGCKTVEGNSIEADTIYPDRDHSALLAKARDADAVIIAFPLYTDMMPGLVTAFLQKLPDYFARERKPSLGFIVHSGFPEGVHTSYMGKFLVRYAARTGCRYIGTVRTGGSEGLDIMPDKMTEKLYKAFRELGTGFAVTGGFDPDIVSMLAGPHRYNILLAPVFYLMKLAGLTDFYWKMKLKVNKAWDKRYARPYSEDRT